jgi:hypothetical protein
MTGSPTTFIKDEPDESFSYNPNRIMAANNYNMQSQQYGQFVQNNGDMSAVNPSELTMMSGQYGQGLSNSFHAGNSGLGDDELLESLGGLDEPPQQYGNFNGGYANQTSQGFFPENAMAMSHGTGNGQMYSHTPDAGPISSPFTNNGFNYDQYRPNTGQQHSYSNSIPTSMGMQNGSFAARRMHPMERHPSDSRSPMTPTTPGLKSLNLGTPDSGHHQNMLNQQLNQHAKMTSEHWGGNSGSQGSYLDSPIPSPHHGNFHHPQISEIIASGKQPGKGENGAHSASLPTAFQSQEAKKKRRRESHNAVERRRRDNINERIHDLSRLVPQHRLEDEKIRKHINNNGTMSPTLTATGMSPPHATSLLAGGSGRRAAGNITQGLPIEEKDKGPNKGDILNGAVSWTRDLMWLLYQKLEEEEKLQELLTQHGATWPFESSEEEKRMRSELKVAVEKNGVQNFNYSRAHGSGLRVPAHTNIAGEPLSPGQSLSPAVQGGAGGSSTNQHNQTNLWVNQHSDSSGRGSFSFKEEDEYTMDTGGL